MKHDILFRRAKKAIPGGVNSPVRAFNGVGGTPVFVESGKGARIRTADGRELTDWCCSWGAMILGHARAEISRAFFDRPVNGSPSRTDAFREAAGNVESCRLQSSRPWA